MAWTDVSAMHEVVSVSMRVLHQSSYCPRVITSWTHLIKKPLEHHLRPVIRPQFLHSIRHQPLRILHQPASLPLPSIILRRPLSCPRERLDRGEPLDLLFRAELFVRRGVAVDRVEGDQRGEGLGGGRVFWSERLAMSTPGCDESDHLVRDVNDEVRVCAQRSSWGYLPRRARWT